MNLCASSPFQLFNTPLHRAVDEDHPEICKVLIKEGKVDVNKQNKVRI